jgi:potassium-dependent mechanosensitive channel
MIQHMFRRLAMAFFAIAFSAMVAGAPALAQQAQATPDATAQPTVAAPTGDANPVEVARKQISDAAASLKAMSPQMEEAGDDDQALAELKMKVDALNKSVLDISVSFNPRLSQIRERLTAVGRHRVLETPSFPVKARQCGSIH